MPSVQSSRHQCNRAGGLALTIQQQLARDDSYAGKGLLLGGNDHELVGQQSGTVSLASLANREIRQQHRR